MIAENLREVENNIDEACRRSGRDRKEVTLISVSKTKPLPDLEEAYAAGARDFGENKPQEMRDKMTALPADIKWHMIGHLQKNKIKYVVPKAKMIHSVDTYELAEAISAHAIKNDMVMPILVEVNVAGEDTKFGIRTEETESFIRSIAVLPGIHVMGLMTIAPYVEDAEENRVHFRKLRNLSIDIAGKNIDNVDMIELSMGMTGDYIVAVEEGATLVRVGTGIFGERNYNK